MRQSKAVLICLLALAILLSLAACSTVPRRNDQQAGNRADDEIYELYPSLLGMDGIDPTLEFCSATVPSAVYSAGDINGDGRVSIADIVLLNAYVKEKITLTSDAQAACDCTGNGVADNTDIRYLQGALLGHTLVITPGKLPTCTDGGLSEGIACSSCQKVLATQSTLSATGHTFIGGVCHCGATEGSMTEEPTIVIGKASGVVGDEVEIIFEMINSPSLYAMSLKIGYDDTALQLVSQQSGEAMEGFTYTSPSQLKNGSRFMWFANDPGEADGTILKLKFKICDTAAAGTYTITMTNDPGNTYDADGNDVCLVVVNGAVAVTESSVEPTKQYTIVFKDYNGTVLSTQTVAEGESAVAPSIPEREGYIFAGWDKDYSNVATDLVVTALYMQANVPTVVIGKGTGVAGDEVEIAFDLVSSPALYALSLKIGYDDTALQLVSQQSGEAMEGFTYTKPSKLKNGARFMWYANDPAEADGTILKLTFKILDSAAAGEYTISMTNDMNNTYDENGADVAVAFVNGSITVVEAEAPAKSYTVIFKDYDGTTISTQTVFQGESAEEPAIPQREGYLFSGWDTAFDHVSDNLTVTATYTKITGPTVVIENAEGKAGDEVTVRIDLMNSPSLYALSLKIGYDDTALQLVSQQSGEAMEGFTYTKPSKLKNGARFMWYANDPAEANGSILELTFKILDSAAAGEYTITMVNDTSNTYDANDNDVDLAFVNGNISVTK